MSVQWNENKVEMNKKIISIEEKEKNFRQKKVV